MRKMSTESRGLLKYHNIGEKDLRAATPHLGDMDSPWTIMETVKITRTLSRIVSSNLKVIDRFLLEKDTKIALKVKGQGQMSVNCIITSTVCALWWAL